MIRKHIIGLLCLAVAAVAVAQLPVDIPREYPFVNYDANRLHYDTASPYMKHLFRKWRRVVDSRQGNLNIVHIGSSHVQGGTYPNRVRTNLMEEVPDLVADRGMLFPYSAAAKCNNPPDYIVHCPEPVLLTRNVKAEPDCELGLCGIAVTAHDITTHIDIVLRPSHIDYATRQVIVVGYSDSNIVPMLSAFGRDIAPSYIDPQTRRFVFNLASMTDSFQIVLPCTQGTAFTLMGVYLGNHQSGFSYHSIGVNGATLADYQKCNYWASDLRLLHPDLVIFGIGVNDAHGPNFDTAVFRQRYLDLIASVREVSPSCAFVFITNNDTFFKSGKGRRRRYTVNPNGELARDVFYRLARDCEGAVWDQFDIMGGFKSMDTWVKNGLAQKDHVHFTPVGYSLLGDMLYNAIVKACYAARIPEQDPLPYKAPAIRMTDTVLPSGHGINNTNTKNTQQPQTQTEKQDVEYPYISY